jgi:flagella basal body P-ring formation protein FlgA
LIRYIILFIILGCSNSFAENNYGKEIENFAESLIFSKYEALPEQDNNEKLHIKISPLDKRHTFTQCMANLTGEIVGNKLKKNTSVKISCPDPDGWTTYIRARILLLVPSVVTSKALSKGQTLNLTNIKLIYADKAQTKNGRFSDVNVLLGTRLKRNLSTDKIIKDRDVCFVCKNDKVSINAIKDGLVIKTSGIALNDANIGRMVRVKNSRTQRIIVGTVSALQEVQVSF